MTASSAFAQEPQLPGFENAPAQNASSAPGLESIPPLGTDQSEALFFENDPEIIQQQIRDDAFNAALDGLLPLRPNEIRKLLEAFDRTQESVALPVHPPPKPEVTVQTLSLDPGVLPSTIKVAHGHVTTFSVLDTSGAPWPIEDISWAGNFEVVEAGAQEGSHIIRISPQSEFARGNMSIRLLELKTPIIVTLETNRESVHYRFDAIIPRYGPQAVTPIIESNALGITAGDAKISSVLEGTSGTATTRLNVQGADGRTTAYRADGTTYIRTPLTLLSPGWTSSVSSADGMRVYAINDTPVILLSDRGKMVRAHLSNREDLISEQ